MPQLYTPGHSIAAVGHSVQHSGCEPAAAAPAKPAPANCLVFLPRAAVTTRAKTLPHVRAHTPQVWSGETLPRALRSKATSSVYNNLTNKPFKGDLF